MGRRAGQGYGIRVLTGAALERRVNPFNMNPMLQTDNVNVEYKSLNNMRWEEFTKRMENGTQNPCGKSERRTITKMEVEDFSGGEK